ncbi:MAG: matrixin family metalloprotease, partial [Myxococcales bacterium]
MTTVPPPGGECPTSGEPLSWQRQCISLSLTATLPDGADGQPLSEPQMRAAVDASLATWTDVECAASPLPVGLEQTAERVTCPHAEYDKSHGNANAILFPDWAGLPPNAFALTMVWHDPDTGEIFDADIQMNRNIGTPAFCAPPCAPGEVDVQTVLTHELGHFLGLAHSDVRDATLN